MLGGLGTTKLLTQPHHAEPTTPSTSSTVPPISNKAEASPEWLVPSLLISPPSPHPVSQQAIPKLACAGPKDSFRSLSLVEARQLTMLLHQSLFPVHTTPKGLMTESIKLAEELHEAGIRWDRQRRVMGLHLKGIWEEGEKLGTGSEMGADGRRAMERYIQGSFLSVAEDPHPLDTMPIPIELSASTRYSSLPKLTLYSGLAHALGATAAVGAVADPALGKVLADAAHNPGTHSMGGGRVLPLGGASVGSKCIGSLNARKKAGLKIKTALPIDARDYAAATVSAHALVSGRFRARGWHSRLWRLLIRPAAFRPNLRSEVLSKSKRTNHGTDQVPGAVSQFKRSLGIGHEMATRGVVPRTARRVVEGSWELR